MQATKTSVIASHASLTTHYLVPLGTQELLGLVVTYVGYYVRLRGSQAVEDEGQLVDEGL